MNELSEESSNIQDFTIIHVAAQTLHESILKKDIQGIKDIIDKHVEEVYFFNDKNESAVRCALETGDIEIYHLLLRKKLLLGPDEDLKEIARSHKFSRQMEIRDINRFYLSVPLESHLIKLLSITKIASYRDTKSYFEEVTQAYNEINAIAEVRLILIIISNAESLEIIFDFNQISVSYLDPTLEKNTFATTHLKKNCIQIAGKNMLNKETYSGVLGTLVHEFSHYAINLLYDNNCDPYREDDFETKEFYDYIVNECRSIPRDEPLIDVVFSYPYPKQSPELIVRVPHLLTFYKHNSEKLKFVSESYKNLFKFYHEKVMVDMQSEVRLIETNRILKELNSLSTTYRAVERSYSKLNPIKNSLSLVNDRAYHLKSNCPILTLTVIYQNFHEKTKFSFAFFIEIHELNPEVMMKFSKAKESNKNVKLVVDCSEESDEEIVLEKLGIVYESDFINHTILISYSSQFQTDLLKKYSFHTKQISHKLNEVSSEARKEFSKKKISFQNQRISLNQFVDETSICDFEFFPLDDLVRNKQIVVGKKTIEGQNSFYIERKFIAEDQNGESKESSIEDVVTCLQEKNVIIISDFPGAGKSETLKALTSKLKHLHPSNWVLLIDLQTILSKFEIKETYFTFNEIVNFLSKVTCKNRLDSEVLKHFFQAGRIFLLIDGIDQTSSKDKSFVLNIISEMQLKAKLLIASRPSFAQEAKKFTSASVIYEHKPFGKKCCESFVNKYYELQKEIDDNSLEFLKETLEKSFVKDCLNPLTLRLICETYKDNSRQKSNMFALFTNIFIKMIQFQLYDSATAKQHFSFQIMEISLIDVFELIAIESLFKQNLQKALYSGSPLNELPSKLKKSFADILSQFWFVRLNGIGLEDVKFTSKTFEDYFVATTIYKNFFRQNFRLLKNDTILLQIVLDILEKESYSAVGNFIEDSLEFFQKDSSILNVRNEYATKHDLDYLRSGLNLHNLVCNGYINIIAYLTYGSRKNNLAFWFKLDDSKKFVMTTAAKLLSLQKFEVFCEIAKNMFGHKQLRKFYDSELLNEFLNNLEDSDKKAKTVLLIDIFCMSVKDASKDFSENIEIKADSSLAERELEGDRSSKDLFTRRSDNS